MGKPNIRLNPQVESVRNRILLSKATEFILSCALLLPFPANAGKGRRPYNYRIVLVLCILRILLRKSYADYETEMREDKRLLKMLGINKLPCKSTVNDYALQCFTMNLLSNFNKKCQTLRLVTTSHRSPLRGRFALAIDWWHDANR